MVGSEHADTAGPSVARTWPLGAPGVTSSPSASKPVSHLLAFLGLLGFILLPAAIVMQIPPQLLVISAALLGLLVLAVRPDAATLLVVAVTYSNAAVVAVRFHDVPFALAAGTVGLLAAPLAYFLLIRRESFVIPSAVPWILAYLLVQLVSTLFAKDSASASEALGVFITEGLLLYLLIVNAVRTERMVVVIVWILLVVAAGLSLISIHQELTGNLTGDYFGFGQRGGDSTGLLPGEEFRSRIAGPVDGPNRYAQILVLVLPLAFAVVWARFSRVASLAAIVCAGLISIAIALTLSRGAAVGFALVVAVMFALRYIRFRYLALIPLAVIALLVAVPQYGERLASLDAVPGIASEAEEADGSIRSRLTEMVAAALVFVDHPIIGVGPDQFQAYYPEYADKFGLRVKEEEREAHNLYVGIASDSGLLGLTAFFGAVIVTLRQLARLRSQLIGIRPQLAHLAAGFMLSIVAYLTTGIFLHLAMERYLWLLMALGAAVWVIGQQYLPSPADGGRDGVEPGAFAVAPNSARA
jgi:putative inorganic carbon (hco3(-)) transporter